MPRKCVVPNCEFKGSSGFSTFPKDPLTRESWLEACQFVKIRPTDRICNNHFKPSDFHYSNKRTFLKKGIVPSIGLPKKNDMNNEETKKDFDLGKSALVLMECQEIDEEKQFSDVPFVEVEKSQIVSENQNSNQDPISVQHLEDHKYNYCPEVFRKLHKEMDVLRKENILLKRRLVLCKRELEKAHKKNPDLNIASIPRN